MSNNPFELAIDRKTVVAIDGANFHASLKQVGWNIDYKRLIDHVNHMCDQVTPIYFTTLTTNDDGFQPMKSIVDYLSYNGFITVTKPVASHTDHDGRSINRSDMCVDLSVKVMKFLNNNAIEHLVLFGGAGEYVPLVNALQEHNVRTTIVSSMGIVSDELRRECHTFIDITPEFRNGKVNKMGQTLQDMFSRPDLEKSDP